jgi:polysaccharide biosynthesis protein PslH
VLTVAAPHAGAARKLGSLISPLPYIVAAHVNPAMNAAVEEALASDRFDVLHCDSISVVPTVPQDARIPKVFNAHNVEAVIWERYVANERRPWMLPVLRSQLARVARFESRLPGIFDCCVAVSDEDRLQMQRRYGAECVAVVPNGADLDYYAPSPDSGEPTLVYVGSLDWRPNQDAVRWLLESIWPLVRSDLPGASLSIVGRRPPGWMGRMCDSAGASLYADVPDVRPYLAAASAVIVPLRIGGGSRLKILEAMAAGRCVVSTSIGAEGLGLRGGQDITIADDAAHFACECVSLLNDPARRAALARSARSLVESRYGWDATACSLEEAWRLALSAARVARDGMTCQ